MGGRLIAVLGMVLYGSGLLVFGAFTGPASATTVDVATETEYRDSLTDLSADASGPHTINITASFTIETPSDPTYTGNQALTIEGGGHTVTSGVGDTRFLLHNSTADLTIRSLVVTGFTRDGIGISGGAVRGNGDVSLVGSTLTENTVTGVASEGGAVSAGGDVSITGSTLSGNSAQSVGGAVGVTGTSAVRVSDSTLSGNSASAGGAISAFSGDVVLTNSTLSGNSATAGGAVRATSGTAILTHATVAGNSAPIGVTVDVSSLTSFGSVLANPEASQDCFVSDSTTSTYSYDTDGSCGFTDPTDTSNGPDPDLGALADNGGPTRTMLPAPGSPLIDAIPEADCHAEVTTDQRGVPRPQDGDEDGTLACDIGAVEVAGPVDDDLAEAPPAGPVEDDPTFAG